MATVEDKAGKEFWNEQWSGNLVPDAADPSKSGLGNLFTKRMDRLFSDIFRDQETEGKLFLELGCGSSIWLPYFAKRFGFEVSGIDYSPAGVDKERAILKKAGVDGDIIQADFFDPPNELLEKFDAVYSYGVAEHFVPTERAISAFASFLRPGGVMITIVPNMTGSVGFLQ
ncbi:MAG TPA: class I SAM-dependent methyltransferase, partial [Pyrinomonadaceae bacterium]|nr:class I SAM-dependent methyltransferase [Pyrinomonadaceae bacterium]